MTLEEQYAVAVTTAFANKVGQAMIAAAIAVQAEAGNTANHVNRANFAALVLRDPGNYQSAFARACVTNAAITGASSDNDIQFTVNGHWNAFSGTI